MPKTDYKVESKQELSSIGRGNQVYTYFRIWATTAKGTYFHVDVPEADLAKSDEYLGKRAKELDAI